jgi:ribosomal protein S18 acetylase RimI-like enzyme
MIRKLSPNDVDQFTRLRRESFKLAPLSFEQEGDVILDPSVVMSQLECTDDQFILGFFDVDGRLGGMMGFNRYIPNKRKHRSYLWGVYLSEKLRGQGIARQLLRQLIQEARSMEGLERIILTVSNHATEALKLYRAEGFVEFGREPGAAKTGAVRMDEVYMLLDL